MKLTVAQERHLFDLCIAAARPEETSPQLAKLGFAEIGEGRFGAYVRITKKGLDFARKLPHPVQRESDWIDRHLNPAFTNSTKKVDSGSTGLAASSPSKGGEFSSMQRPKRRGGIPLSLAHATSSAAAPLSTTASSKRKRA